MAGHGISEILQQYWGYSAFRPLQQEIISSVLDGNDTLALLPTGGGKSICYQVPALAQDGLCIVISPLIALMKDQVEDLQSRGIKAIAVFSGMSIREIDVALDNAAYGDFKFLYVSPERLETEIFLARASKFKVNLIAVDEAHCISQWGYDFRPSYLKIADIRSIFPDVPILALTASATPKVQDDICEKLQFKKDFKLFSKSFDRPNLVYASIFEEDKPGRLVKLFSKVKGTALVYTSTRRHTKEVANLLKQNGLSADFYHAGLQQEERSKKQEDWKQNRTRIMVCTNAFGMGIDKPDVRMVVHYNLPDSLEAYYQEAGRAGRDEKKAFAIALVNNYDKQQLEEKVEKNQPDVAEIRHIYHALGNYFQLPLGNGENRSFDFDINEFGNKYALQPIKVFQALKVLETAGYLSLTESVFLPSRLKVLVDNHTLYSFEIAHKQYEPLIKTVLRSYGGAFEEYVRVNEQEIARRLASNTKKVIQDLIALQRMEMIDYQQQKNSPQITYLIERLPEENLLLDAGLLNERKKSYAQRIQSVLEYAFAEGRCRGKMLQQYFGENTEDDCGHCDYCIKKDKDNFSEKRMQQIRDQIFTILQENNDLNLPQLLGRLKLSDEKPAVKVIRKMIDEKILGWKDDQILTITAKA